jgi:RecB family exonuclease
MPNEDTGLAPESYQFRKHGVTVSLLQKFERCRYAAKLYLAGWTPVKSTGSLFFGSLFHDMLHHVYEHFRTEGPPKNRKHLSLEGVRVARPWLEKYHREAVRIMGPSEVQDLENDIWTCLALLRPYLRFWRRDFYDREWVGLESEFRVKFQDQYVLRGKRDGVFLDKHGKLRILETKTKARFDNPTVMGYALALDMQNLFYLVATELELGRRPTGVTYNMIRRPSLRQGKKESGEAFASRIRADIVKRKLHYFVRYEVDYPRSDVRRFEDELEIILEEFKNWVRKGGDVQTYRNRTACISRFNCPYLALCGSSDSFTDYMVSRIFTELEAF